MDKINFEQELYKQFGQVKDFTLGVRIAKYFYELRHKEEPVNEDLEEEIKRMIYDSYYDVAGIAIKGTSLYLKVEGLATIARHFAQWQKNSVWHSGKEEPKIDAKILVVPLTSDAFGGQYYGNGVIVSSRDHEITLRPTSKWCYLKDILPNKED